MGRPIIVQILAMIPIIPARLSFEPPPLVPPSPLLPPAAGVVVGADVGVVVGADVGVVLGAAGEALEDGALYPQMDCPPSPA
jgi:hypothetical protein